MAGFDPYEDTDSDQGGASKPEFNPDNECGPPASCGDSDAVIGPPLLLDDDSELDTPLDSRKAATVPPKGAKQPKPVAAGRPRTKPSKSESDSDEATDSCWDIPVSGRLAAAGKNLKPAGQRSG